VPLHCRNPEYSTRHAIRRDYVSRSRHADVFLRQPEIDSLTDDDEGPNKVVRTFDVQGEPGTLETHYLFQKACKCNS
jgi:hypothetical protein